MESRRSPSESGPTRSTEPSKLSPASRIAIELGNLALAMGEELLEERLVLMATDLEDLNVDDVCCAIRCWRRGTLKLANPDDMRKLPTAFQLRAWVTRPRIRYIDGKYSEPVNPE